MVKRLFIAVPQGCLRFVIVVFPDHTHSLFFIKLKVSIMVIKLNVSIMDMKLKV